MSKKAQETVTWMQVNNVVPIIVTLITTTVSVVLIYTGLSNKIDLLTQRVDTLIDSQKTITAKYEGVQARLGRLELDHQKFDTELEQHLRN